MYQSPEFYAYYRDYIERVYNRPIRLLDDIYLDYFRILEFCFEACGGDTLLDAENYARGKKLEDILPDLADSSREELEEMIHEAAKQYAEDKLRKKSKAYGYQLYEQYLEEKEEYEMLKKADELYWAKVKTEDKP